MIPRTPALASLNERISHFSNFSGTKSSIPMVMLDPSPPDNQLFRNDSHFQMVETVYGNSDFLKKSMDLLVQRTEDKQKGKERSESFSITTTRKQSHRTDTPLDLRRSIPAVQLKEREIVSEKVKRKKSEQQEAKKPIVEGPAKSVPPPKKPKTKKIQAAEQVTRFFLFISFIFHFFFFIPFSFISSMRVSYT